MNKLLDPFNIFYIDVQNEVRRLEIVYGDRLRCKSGCSACCVDDITVYEVEAENIRLYHKCLNGNCTPGPSGKCAFLTEEGACKIYRARPYVCRTQGLPLRWVEELSNGNIADMRDICRLNEKEISVETLNEESCWTIGSWEARLANLQANLYRGIMTRISLRELCEEL